MSMVPDVSMNLLRKMKMFLEGQQAAINTLNKDQLNL